jgi:carbonic anhydrase
MIAANLLAFSDKQTPNIRKLKAHKAEAQKPKPLWLACALVVACS